MTTLPEPRVQAVAIARMIQIRAMAIANRAAIITETTDPMTLKPEDWEAMPKDLQKLLEELNDEIEIFATKAGFAT